MSGDVGCFVFRVLETIAVRRAASTERDFKTKRSFEKGDLVSVDLKVDSGKPGTGSFLKLSDGSGWLFERKSGRTVLESVDVETGLWCFYLGNFPVGLAPRNHPIDLFLLLGVDEYYRSKLNWGIGEGIDE